MRATRAVVFAIAVFALSVAPARAAANKEHQQLMAEIRMLQEQQQQLQQLLGNLTDALKGVSSKLDDQSAAMRKAMADQTLATNGIGENVRVLREKMDDTNVRVSSVSQEIEALRQAISSTQPAPQPLTPAAPGAEPTAGTPPAAQGQMPSTNPTTNPVPSGVSPQKMYDQVFDDYTAGRFDLAVLGFQSYIQAYPRTTKAAEAQLYIGALAVRAGKVESRAGRIPEGDHGLPAVAVGADGVLQAGPDLRADESARSRAKGVRDRRQELSRGQRHPARAAGAASG